MLVFGMEIALQRPASPSRQLIQPRFDPPLTPSVSMPYSALQPAVGYLPSNHNVVSHYEVTIMESKRCKKHTGVGVSSNLQAATSSQLPAPSAAAPLSATLHPAISPACQYTNTRGHRCHMLPADDHSSLCPHHVRQALKREQRQNEAVAKELLGDLQDFSTAGSVNYFLGNLVKQLARKRIARRDAIALAYVSQLLLNSVRALNRENKTEEDATAAQFLLQAFQKPKQQGAPAGA